MGSTKDITYLKQPTDSEMGVARMRSTDDISVGDWGRLPDTIPYKGAALCMVAALMFELAEEFGMKTHYRGLIGNDGQLVRTKDLDHTLDTMEVNMVRVIRPEFKNGKYDYFGYKEGMVNYLLPLELIYRNTLPKGSSIFKRLANGSLTPLDLGLDHYPQEGEKLSLPYYDVTTKLESTDRPLSWKEAAQISGLSVPGMSSVQNLLGRVNHLITNVAINSGFDDNGDGKIEVAVNPLGELMVVDFMGTFDECRLTFNGEQVSKEPVRQHYLDIGWMAKLTEAKARAKAEGTSNWKQFVTSPPPLIPASLIEIVSDMYTGGTNKIYERIRHRKIFDSPPLEETVERYRRFRLHC